MDKIRGIVKSLVDSFGFALDDMEYITQGKRWLIRIYIDKEGGVTLEDCEKFSRQLSCILETKNIIAHAYTLEVSSPGLDRPLKRIEDYIKHKGRLIKLNTVKPYDNKNTFIGRILSVEKDLINIQTEKDGLVGISFTDIANARMEVEF